MTDSRNINWIVRKSREDDLPGLHAHFSRMDDDSLYCRFGMAVSATFLKQYIDEAGNRETTIFVAEIDGAIRAIGELRQLLALSRGDAEAAFTVEPSFRDRGIGTSLMTEVIEEARRRGVCDVFICFNSQNGRMRRIAEKFKYSVTSDGVECVGRVSVASPYAPTSRGIF